MHNMENLFCAGYLLFAFTAGSIFLSREGAFFLGCAVMTFLLAGGDAFHLIPRIIANLRPGWPDQKRWLGLGNLISSITMTLFYVALARVMDISEPGIMPAALPVVLIILSVIRICLCCAPANNWSGDGGSQRWRLYRNIPFLITGIMTVLYLTVLYRKWLLAVLVALSFFFYSFSEKRNGYSSLPPSFQAGSQ